MLLCCSRLRRRRKDDVGCFKIADPPLLFYPKSTQFKGLRIDVVIMPNFISWLTVFSAWFPFTVEMEWTSTLALSLPVWTSALVFPPPQHWGPDHFKLYYIFVTQHLSWCLHKNYFYLTRILYSRYLSLVCLKCFCLRFPSLCRLFKINSLHVIISVHFIFSKDRQLIYQ